jgi:hypothetical protein
MKSEQRKAQRRPIRYRAWIEAGGSSLGECKLVDASDSGARLLVESSDVVPEQFSLRFSALGEGGRKSRVVWRSESEVGIAFDRPKPGRRGRK